MSIVQQAIDTFSLSQHDAQHLENNHHAALSQALTSPALGSVTLNFIEKPVIPAGWESIMSDPLNPSQALKERVKLYFSRICFIVNTPEFKNLFNNNVNLLRPASNNPANFDAFNRYLNQQINQDYDAVVDISTFRNILQANAYGLRNNGLKMFIDEDQILNSPSYNNQGLLLHELMHTAGYEHVGDNDGFNDIPEYVQLLLMPGGLNRSAYPTLSDLSNSITQSHRLPANTGNNKDIVSHYFD